MPGLLAAFCSKQYIGDEQDLREIMNPFGLAHVETSALPEGTMMAAHVENHPLGGRRFYEDQDVVACFSGDIVGVRSIPWERIIPAFKAGAYTSLCELRGYFAIVVYDKRRRRVFAVNDRKGQEPIFYGMVGDGFVLTTQMAAFCRFKQPREFDKRWLYEYMFFNFGVGETTFLKGVRRLPPGFVIEYGLDSKQISISRYAPLFRKSEKLITGDRAFEKGLEVCKAAIPKYYSCESGDIAAALTAGWDSRTVLAFMPEESKRCLTTFTYGVKGADDIDHAAMVAQALGMKHIIIPLGDDFEAVLPEILRQNIYINSGAPRISLSHLLYVYRTLTEGGKRFRSIVGAVAGDMFFRGHDHNVPAIMSASMDRVFMEGRAVIDEALYGKMFGRGYGEFAEHINADLDRIREMYGDFDDSATLLAYLAYDVAIGYFAAETTTVGNYSCFRAPFWDDDIVALAFQIDSSTLGTSRYVTRKADNYGEQQFHAHMLMSNPQVAKIPMQGWPVRSFVGPKNVYRFHRVLAAVRRRLVDRKFTHITPVNWGGWLNTALKKTVDDTLFTKAPLIGEYMSEEFLTELRTKRDMFLITKATTAELVLGLVKNGWRLR